MPQLGRKPPDLDDEGNVIVEGVTKNSIKAKPATKPPDLNDDGSALEAESPGILDSIGGWLNQHPRIKEIGTRMLTGTSPEFEELSRQHMIKQLSNDPVKHAAELERLQSGGNVKVMGTPESEVSLLPEWKSQPESYAGGFSKSIYNDFIRPLATPSGFAGSGEVRGPAALIPELLPRGPQKMLPSGPRFYGGEAGTIDINAIDRPNALPISRELPYRRDDIPRFMAGENPLGSTGVRDLGETPEPYFPKPKPTSTALVRQGVRDTEGIDLLGEHGKIGGDQTPFIPPPESGAPRDFLREFEDYRDRNPHPLDKTVANPSDDISLTEPLFARAGKGAKLGQNIARSANELTSGYSGPLPGIMVREGMQNAIDAVRHLGPEGDIKVTVSEPNRTITISDNGKGMTRHQLQTVYSNLNETGKIDEAGASGGKGVGKATFMLGGEHFRVETVTNMRGQKIKLVMEGTKDQFLKGGWPIKYEKVADDTPTGTSFTTKLKEGQSSYDAREMADNILNKSRGVNSKVTLNKYGVDNPTNFHTGEGDVHIGSKDLLNNDVSISIPGGPDGVRDTRGYVYLDVSNNGMYQYSKYFPLGEEVGDMPSRIAVDIKPKMTEDAPDYPFPVQRESVKDNLQKEIDDFIKDKLVNPIAEGRKTKLKELYDSMQQVVTGTKRKGVFYDPGNRLSPEELNHFTSSPTIQNFIMSVDHLLDQITGALKDPKITGRLEGVGIVLDPNMHGVHIPNPSSGGQKSTILLNPFITIGNDNPVDAALNIVVTSMHEAAHIGMATPLSAAMKAEELNDPRIGKYLQTFLKETMEQGGLDMGHGFGFVKRLGEIYAKFGAKKALRGADTLQGILTGGSNSGEYSPEVQRLLSIYQESRGREATVEDFLSGTGVKQAAKGGGKGNIPSNNNPNGTRVTVQSSVDKLLKSVQSSKGLRTQQDALVRAEKARRFAEFDSVKQEGISGAKLSLSKLRGEYPKINKAPIQLNEQETDTLFSHIKGANITAPEKARAYTALFKMINGGEVLQRNEIGLLGEVFGGGFGDKIVEMQGGLGVVNHNLGKSVNTMKALSSSLDLSAPLRQGIGLIHRKEWRGAFKEMFKYLADDEYYRAAMTQLERRPTYLLGRESGLFLNKPGTILASEEAFMKNYIPEISKILPPIGKLANASERAYTGFLNKLRADTFDNMVAQAKGLGHEAFTTVKTPAGGTSIHPTAQTEAIAKYVNYATGRGGLGKLEKIAPELNYVLWSPRLITSRLGMLANPSVYMGMPPGMRREGLKSLVAIAALGTTVGALGSLAGGRVLGNPFGAGGQLYNDDKVNLLGGRNPQILSADAGKVRFGEKVLDPWGGYQQPIIAMARMLAGRTDSRQQSMAATAGNFMANKLSPIGSLAYDLATAKKFTGGGGYTDAYNNKKTIPKEIGLRFAPMILQDLHDLATSDPGFAEATGLNTALAAAGVLGMGVQDYPERRSKPRPMIRKMSLAP